MSETWNTWNHEPPAAPPVTDADPCVAWGAPHTHDHATDPTQAAPYDWYAYGAPTPPPPPPSSPPTKRGGGARVALATAVVVGLLGAGYATHDVLNRTTQPIVTATASTSTPVSQSSTPLVSGNDEEPVTAVAKALGPSVVVIKNTEGLGSGVVFDSKGLILTNAHVVGTAKTVSVTIKDGKTYEGKVLGADTANDIAVVQVTPDGDLPAARLATTPAEVGQLAVAVGSPFGLDETVTAGVVSAVNRPVDNGAGGVASMIQTDAPINPGNSGGALANRRGEVIGINSQIYSQKGENNGIGFAIPIDKAKSIADKITGGDSLDRPYLGVSSKAATDGTAGAVIQQVESGSAAAKAGIQTGDQVTAVDDTTIKESTDLAAAIGTHSPGDTVTLTVTRDGQPTKVTVTLGSKPATATPAQGSDPSGSGSDGSGSGSGSDPSGPGSGPNG